MIKNIFIIFFLFCAYLFPQNTKEAGMYHRKSITILDVVPVDSQTQKLSNEYIEEINGNIKKALTTSRFDFNPISDSIREIYKKEVIKNTVGRLATEDILKEIVKENILSEVLNHINKESDKRATRILSQQQQNSFITDKAKESAITEEEIISVLDSSYIITPLVWGYKEYKDTSGNPCVQISTSAYLFKIKSSENTLILDTTIYKKDNVGIGKQYDKEMQEIMRSRGRPSILSWDERKIDATKEAIENASVNFFSFESDRLTSQITWTTPGRIFTEMDKEIAKDIYV